jgi:uncharacterized cofD-like protein
MFLVEGAVHPAALEYTDLCANFEGGLLAAHEQEVDQLIRDGHTIERIRLAQAVTANDDAVQAILDADIIVISPGSWYTSVIPPLLPEGMTEAIGSVHTPLVWVVNLLTEGDDMRHWTGASFIRELMHFTGRTPAALLVNSVIHELPPSYAQERKYPIAQTLFRSYAPQVYRYPLWLDAQTPRHDAGQLAAALGILLPQLLP